MPAPLPAGGHCWGLWCSAVCIASKGREPFSAWTSNPAAPSGALGQLVLLCRCWALLCWTCCDFRARCACSGAHRGIFLCCPSVLLTAELLVSTDCFCRQTWGQELLGTPTETPSSKCKCWFTACQKWLRGNAPNQFIPIKKWSFICLLPTYCSGVIGHICFVSRCLCWNEKQEKGKTV